MVEKRIKADGQNPTEIRRAFQRVNRILLENGASDIPYSSSQTVKEKIDAMQATLDDHESRIAALEGP